MEYACTDSCIELYPRCTRLLALDNCIRGSGRRPWKELTNLSHIWTAVVNAEGSCFGSTPLTTRQKAPDGNIRKTKVSNRIEHQEPGRSIVLLFLVFAHSFSFVFVDIAAVRAARAAASG